MHSTERHTSPSHCIYSTTLPVYFWKYLSGYPGGRLKSRKCKWKSKKFLRKNYALWWASNFGRIKNFCVWISPLEALCLLSRRWRAIVFSHCLATRDTVTQGSLVSDVLSPFRWVVLLQWPWKQMMKLKKNNILTYSISIIRNNGSQRWSTYFIPCFRLQINRRFSKYLPEVVACSH